MGSVEQRSTEHGVADLRTAALIHEIAQPLACITANAWALNTWVSKGGPIDAEVADTVADILLDVDRARALMESVRGWFTDSAQARVTVDLSTTLRRVVARATSTPGVQVTAAVTARLDDALCVDAEPVLLEHALRNLVSNAIEASCLVPSPGVSVDVKASRSGSRIVVTVSDKGPGFTAEALARATEPFFTMRKGGLGVGLAIVQWFAESHGGHLTIFNGARGARVELSLPAALLPEQPSRDVSARRV